MYVARVRLKLQPIVPSEIKNLSHECSHCDTEFVKEGFKRDRQFLWELHYDGQFLSIRWTKL